MKFADLVKRILEPHERFYREATKAVNTALTIRNWVIGFSICEFQLKGQERAAYGDRLFEKLSDQLANKGMQRIDERELRRFRQFYLTYPQIRESLTPKLAAIPALP